MRTTLTIADDVFLAVKERAKRENRKPGEILTDLARQALAMSRGSGPEVNQSFFGFEPLPSSGRPVSNQVIDRIRDEQQI